MNCTSQLLEDFLNRYGWAYEKCAEDTWLTGWSSESGEYPLMIHLSDETILFEVRPFMEFDLELNMFPEFLVKIMELNDQSRLVKIALSPEGDLILAVHALTLFFSYEHFANIVGIMGFYADEFRREINLYQATVGIANYEMPEYLS